MAVSPVMNNSSTTTSSSSSLSGTSAEDLMNNFMTLLVAQMQNQDPTNPMDNSQLTSQLAQFNTTAGVQNLNTTVNNVGTLLSSMQQMNSAEWVGRKVLVEGTPTITPSGDGNKNFALSVDSDSDVVGVTLTDTAGTTTYTGTLTNVKAGVHQYSLQDLSNFEPGSADDLPDGTYSVSYTVANKDGTAPSVVGLKTAMVDSVDFTQAGSVLQLGMDGTATLSDVYRIE
ncbi:flagellar biosynthesis protein FlgD [Enterobacter pasteurii]|uniref:flagellar hook assembly protein FlgD n=1 Tax=Enterobacter pasteurii TaxID=3029761 RepID=UPI0011DD18A5|nr:flagellar hook capping FlgD N-terminal domain-containing protein [Enterobacter pasteurii]QLA68114.1 flagellar biosynthesis protein FlgD [Enterobacter pasteurii]